MSAVICFTDMPYKAGMGIEGIYKETTRMAEEGAVEAKEANLIADENKVYIKSLDPVIGTRDCIYDATAAVNGRDVDFQITANNNLYLDTVTGTIGSESNVGPGYGGFNYWQRTPRFSIISKGYASKQDMKAVYSEVIRQLDEDRISGAKSYYNDPEYRIPAEMTDEEVEISLNPSDVTDEREIKSFFKDYCV